MYTPPDTRWLAGYTTSLRDLIAASERVPAQDTENGERLVNFTDDIRLEWMSEHPELAHLWAVAVSDD